MITSDAGTRIVTDPYEPGGYDGALKYGPLREPADIVTISHEHSDHAYHEMVPGKPIIIRGAGMFVVEGIEFVGVQTAHDTSGGEERGKNVAFTFIVDGVKIAHLGDLGHVLTPEHCAQIGAVDVLLTPVGGFYTIGPDEAWKVADQLAAKVVIPMHYKTDKVAFPIVGVDEFLKGKTNVRFAHSSTVEIRKEHLPAVRQIVVLDHAL
jgi:L-ascorbate metabolism protein UlaG (beta-lactamase superfamily)